MKTITDGDYYELYEKGKVRDIGPIFRIKELDENCHGLPRRLVVIGGFSGSFKTTLALNVVYNNAVYQGWNCCFLSLEMETDEIQLRFLVLHAQHPKFSEFNVVITLEKVFKHMLTQEETDFLFHTVAPDFKKP